MPNDYIECPICRQSFKLRIHCADCEAKDKELVARDAEVERLERENAELRKKQATAADYADLGHF